MSFRASKLNIKLLQKLNNAPTNTAVGEIVKIARGGNDSNLYKTILSNSKNNLMLRTWQQTVNDDNGPKISEKAFWRTHEASNINKITTDSSSLGVHASTKVAKNIVPIPRTVSGPLMWPQNNNIKLRYKLTKWSLGLIPGKPEPCKGYTTGDLAFREHLLRCQRVDELIKRIIKTYRRLHPPPRNLRPSTMFDKIISYSRCAECPSAQRTPRAGDEEDISSNLLGDVAYVINVRSCRSRPIPDEHMALL